jgi:hypothetical protein
MQNALQINQEPAQRTFQVARFNRNEASGRLSGRVVIDETQNAIHTIPYSPEAVFPLSAIGPQQVQMDENTPLIRRERREARQIQTICCTDEQCGDVLGCCVVIGCIALLVVMR